MQLSDSFPGGKIPYSAVMAMDQQAMASKRAIVDASAEIISGEDTPESQMKRRRVARFSMNQTVRRILRRAAAREELDNEQNELFDAPGGWDKTPIILALGLLAKGFVRPLDIIWVSCLTTYFVVLNMVARSPREGGLTPIMPAMPPQGHVPTLVSNPLGVGTLYSSSYDKWLKLGIVLGLIAPLLQVLRSAVQTDEIAIARLFARPIFLLCCQAVSEAISRKSQVRNYLPLQLSHVHSIFSLVLFPFQVPLPIRILIPIAYNTARLPYLWTCASTTLTLGVAGRTLAIANVAYWSANLFTFLIPVALVRYMRAYFFAVEASEVTTRIGMEDSVGLVPNKQ